MNQYKSLYGNDADPGHTDSTPHILSAHYSNTLPVPCVSKLVTASDTSFNELSKSINILNKELRGLWLTTSQYKSLKLSWVFGK